MIVDREVPTSLVILFPEYSLKQAWFDCFNLLTTLLWILVS